MTLGRNVRQGNTKADRKKSHKAATFADKEKTCIIYDTDAKCWKSSAKGNVDTLKITRIKKNNERQRQRQIPEAVQHDRKKAQGYSDPDLDVDEDTISVSMDVHKEVPRIKKPFVQQRSTKHAEKDTNWSMPKSTRSVDVFHFEKPVSESIPSTSYNSPAHRVLRLKEELKQKDNELDMLRTQLVKSQRENMKLVNELRQCSGQKYGDVVKENLVLKEQAGRLTRQIAKMWGDDKRDKNHILHRLECEQKLETQKVKEFTSANS